MDYNLFEYIDTSGTPVFTEWRRRLQKVQQAKLDVKVNLLRTIGSELPPSLLAGTSAGHIKKLKVKGNVQLRPRLCLGPINNGSEFSLLVGVFERDMKSVPENADEIAVQRRQEILDNPNGRRCAYVP